MVKSIIGGLFRFVGILAFILVVAGTWRLITPPEPHQSAYTYGELGKINPVMVIDTYTLVDREVFGESLNRAMGQLIDRGVIVNTQFGPLMNPSLKDSGYSIPILIQSGGGLVKLGLDLAKAFSSLKEGGIKITCHVAEAQSMAFYIMVTVCDKVIAKRSATIMMHKSAYGAAGYTPSTYLIDMDMAKAEAYALGVDYGEWIKLTRGPEDHVFSILEIEKYGLVDEWVD